MIDNENKAIVETKTYTRFHTGRAWSANGTLDGNDWGVFLYLSNGETSANGAFSLEEAREIVRLIQEAIAEAETSESVFGVIPDEDEYTLPEYDDVE